MKKRNGNNMYNRKLETMSRDESRSYFDKKVQWVIDYAYKNAPAIKDKLDKERIDPNQINSVKDLERVPIMHKEDLIELQKKDFPFGGFLAVPPEKIWKYFYSTGPINGVAGNSESFWNMQKKIFYNVGFRRKDVVLITFSYHLVSAGWDADEALRQLGAIVIPGGVGNTEQQVEAARTLEVTGYVGTPSFLIALIKRAEKMGYNFKKDFKLSRAAVGGEPLADSLRDDLENTYGISVFNIFGSADVHWIGYECEQKKGMHIAEEVLLEIVDPETGKQVGYGDVGEMVVTSFDETYPLIRFGLGDLACLTDEPCPCGRTSLRLVKFAGRVRDVVRVRARFIYPNSVRKAMDFFSEISKYQLVISRKTHRDELTFLIELAREDVKKYELLSAVQKSFKEQCLLKIDEVKFVPSGAISNKDIMIDERTWE